MKRLMIIATLVAFSISSKAEDVYLVQASALGYLTVCERVSWETDAIFYNRGTVAATVSFAGTSNGPIDETMTLTSFTIPAGQTASLVKMTGRSWGPRSNASQWVTKVDVEGEVEIKDILVIGTDFYSAGCIRGSGAPVEDRGRTAYPVFRRLTPPNETQIHLGTYLGADTPGRLNVGIYNAAAVDAIAAVYVRRHCDEAVVASKFIAVPSNTIVQVPVFSGLAPTDGCPVYQSGQLGGPSRSLYTVVTVDQPSFSYVANVIDSQAPIAGIVISPP